MIRELEKASHHVAITHVQHDGKDWVVSTVKLSPTIKRLDEIISMFPTMKDRADLSAPGDYETMVFTAYPNGTIEDFTELTCRRYETFSEAQEGHIDLVQEYSGG